MEVLKIFLSQLRTHRLFVLTIVGLVVITVFLAWTAEDRAQYDRLRLALEDQRERLVVFRRQQEESVTRLTDQIIQLQRELRRSQNGQLQTEKGLLLAQQALRQALGIEEHPREAAEPVDTNPASPELAGQMRKEVAANADMIGRVQKDIWANEEAFLGAARELAADQLALTNLERAIATLKHASSLDSSPPKTLNDFLLPEAAQVAEELAHKQSPATVQLPSAWPIGTGDFNNLARRYATDLAKQQRRLRGLQDALVAVQKGIVAAQQSITRAREEEAALLKSPPVK